MLTPHAKGWMIGLTFISVVGVAAGALAPAMRKSQSIHPKSGKPITTPGRDGEAIRLHNGWKITPAGRSITTGDFLIGGAFSPNGKLYAIANAGYTAHGVHIIDVTTEKEVAKIPLGRAWSGIAWSQDGASLFVSAGSSNAANAIYVIRQDPTGEWKTDQGFKLRGADPKSTCVSGLAVSKDGKALYALNIEDGRLYILDISSGDTLSSIPVGNRPSVCGLAPDGATLGVACWGSAEIAAVNVSDPLKPTVFAHLSTGRHPNAVAMSSDARVYITCGNDDTVSVFDTRTGAESETIHTAMTTMSPEGSTPVAVAIAPDNNTLYVANADNNDICVVDVSARGQHKIKGFIPTGWYPTSIAVTPDGKRLLVGSGKGLGTGPNTITGPIGKEYTSGFKHHGNNLSGLLSFVDVPDQAKLQDYTKTVLANSPYNDEQLRSVKSPVKTAIPTRVGMKSPIKHVLYIIKENRTYDQVFSDLPQGNGDPNLLLFGREVTPNHHALAEQFVMLDNLYCSGEVSADGHPWCTSAYCTDYVQRAWVLSYSGHGGLDTDDSVENPRSGYLWDECARKKLTYRSYGEYISATNSENAPQASIVGTTGLKGHESRSWMGLDRPKGSAEWRDTDKADAFIAEYKEFEKTNSIPQFMVMSLGEDHTSGARIGAHTPKASVASNDQALGKIVETISHSKSWKEFAIFVIEDDAQNGPDHVDSHRTCGLVISPYTRRGVVDSTMYQTTSMIRTMELILGLNPLSQYDASATPMFASFTNRADLRPYKRLDPQIDLNARNKPRDPGARESARLDLSGYDRADDQEMNRILWMNIKGVHAKLPAPRHRVIAAATRPAADRD